MISYDMSRVFKGPFSKLKADIVLYLLYFPKIDYLFGNLFFKNTFLLYYIERFFHRSRR